MKKTTFDFKITLLLVVLCCYSVASYYFGNWVFVGFDESLRTQIGNTIIGYILIAVSIVFLVAAKFLYELFKEKKHGNKSKKV